MGACLQSAVDCAAFAWSASSCDSYRFATLVLAPFANLWFVCVEQIFELGDVLEKYFPDLILVRFRHISCFSISSLHTVIMKQHPQLLIREDSGLRMSVYLYPSRS